MDTKQNDWVLTTLANPSFNFDDFKSVGVDANTTSIYDRERYLNSNLIQNTPQFQTNGRFDQAKFNTFYDKALKDYNAFAEYTSQPETSRAMFSYNNIWVDKEKRKTAGGGIDFNIVPINNPDRRKFGIEKIGYISNPTMTPEEIAQDNKVWDTEKQTWTDSPNSSGLRRNWFKPLVMATYDYDVDAQGRPTLDESKVVHKKGEYKINPETGTYYYETLGNREVYGKQVLSPFDVITTDGSAANKYDFFDSDGIDKSVIGTITKNVMRIAPAFVPYVKGAYIALNVGLEAAKFLPVIYKSSFGLLSDDNSIANNIEAFATQFDNNKISVEGQQSFFSSESMVNMIADVTNQLVQQRWLFTKAPKAFKKYGITGTKDKPSELQLAAEQKAQKWTEQAIEKGLAGETKLTADEAMAASLAKSQIWQENYIKDYQEIGKHISRLYMTGTSSFQAFEDAKAEGASDVEAAALFWGYFTGMYGIMATDIGEHVLPELRLQKRELRDILLRVSEQGAPKTVKEEVTQFKNIFQRAGKKAQEIWKKAASPTIAGGASIMSNMLAEGVEEVSEEALYDLTKVTFNLLNKFSGSDTHYAVFDNMLQRYGSSFVGGFIGGGIFEGVNVKKYINTNINRPYDPTNQEANQSLIYMIRNGEKREALNSLEYLRKNKMLGDVNLSTTIDHIDGDQIIYKPGTNEDNQNEYVYKLMVNYINNIDTVLNQEGMNLSDETLLKGDGITQNDIIKYLRANYLTSSSPSVGRMLQDYNTMGDRFVALHSELDALNHMDDQKKRSDVNWQNKVDEVQRQLTDLRKEREEFLSEETQKYYTGLMMFGGNSEIARAFTHVTYRDFIEAKFKKPFEQLTDFEKEKGKEEYQEYLSLDANEKIRKGYDIFMAYNNKFGLSLAAVGKNAEAYREARKKLLQSVIEVNEINPETGEVVTDDEGNPVTKSLNLAGIIVKMFGDPNLSDEEVKEKAKELTQYANPFSEIRRFILSGAGKLAETTRVVDPDTLEIYQKLNPELTRDTTSPQYVQALNIMDSFIQNLEFLLNDGGYVDEEIANGIQDIKDQLIKIPPVILGSEDLLGDPYVIDNDDIYNAVVRNFLENSTLDNVRERYATAKEFLQNYKESHQDDADIIDSISQTLESKVQRFLSANAELIEKNDAINQLLQRKVLNPIYKLLQDVIVTTTGGPRSIITLLQEIEDMFVRKTAGGDISKFIIDGTIQIDDVENALLILSQVQALIRAAQVDKMFKQNPFNFNGSMNAIGGTDQLGEIDHITASLLINDLEAFKRKLNFVQDLHNINAKASLKEQTEAGVNLNYLIYDLIGDSDGELYNTVTIGDDGARTVAPKEIGGEAFIDTTITAAINNATTLARYKEMNPRPTDIPLEDQAAIAKEKMDIENALYDRIQKLISDGHTLDEIIPIVFSKYINNGEDIGINNTPIKKDATQMDKAVELAYLTSIIANKSGDFLSMFKTYLDEDNSSLAPLPPQVMSIQICYAMIQNKDIFNKVLAAINPEQYSRTSLQNCIMASGIPGAGKTSAVAKIVYDLVKKGNNNVRTFTVGPTSTQANNLKESLSPEESNNTVYTKEELLRFLGTTAEEINADDAVEKEGSVPKVTCTVKESFKDRFDTTNPPNIIFIDEATVFTNAEMQLITMFAKQIGATVILTGDLQQSAKRAFWTHEGYPLYNSITTCVPFCTPPLAVSMRVSNTNKRDNTNTTSELAQKFSMETILNGEFGTSPVDVLTYIREFLKAAPIKGSVDDNGRIFGDILRNKPDLSTDAGKEAFKKEIQQMLDSLQDKEKIGYIYEDETSEIYQFIKNNFNTDRITLINKMEFYSEATAQGSEHQYFIIDVNWDTKYQRLLNAVTFEAGVADDVLTFIQSLHTTISRSKQGSMIIDNGLTSILASTNFKDIDAAQVNEVKPSQDMLINYKAEQISILETTLAGYTPTTPTTPTPNPAPEPPSGPTPPPPVAPDTSGSEPPEPVPPPTIPPSGGSEPPETPPPPFIPAPGVSPAAVTPPVVDAVLGNITGIQFNGNTVVVLKMSEGQIPRVMSNGYSLSSNPVVVTTAADLINAVDSVGMNYIAAIAVIPNSDPLQTTVMQGQAQIPSSYISTFLKPTNNVAPTPSGNATYKVNDIVSMRTSNGTAATQYLITEIGPKEFNGPDGNYQALAYTLRNVKTGEQKIWAVSYVDSKYAKVGTFDPTPSNMTVQQQVIANEIQQGAQDGYLLTDVELTNLQKYSEAGSMGIKLYSSLCFRKGIDFEITPNNTFKLTQLGTNKRQEENPSDLNAFIAPFLNAVDNNGKPMDYDPNTMWAQRGPNGTLTIMQRGTTNVVGTVRNPELPINVLNDLKVCLATIRSILMFNDGDLNRVHEDITKTVSNLYNKNADILYAQDPDHIPLVEQLFDAQSNSSYSYKVKVFKGGRQNEPNQHDPAVDGVLGMGSSYVPNRKLLVYSIPGCMEITMGVFPLTSTLESYIKRLKNTVAQKTNLTPQEIDTLTRTIENLEKTIPQVHFLKQSTYDVFLTYFDLGEFNLSDCRITNSKRADAMMATESVSTISFETFKNDPNVICSDAFLFTDVNKGMGIVDPSTAGKAVAYFTTDLNLYYGTENGRTVLSNTPKPGFTKITQNNRNELERLWSIVREEAVRTGDRSVLNSLGDKISMVVLSPRGVSLEEFFEQAVTLKQAFKNGNESKYVTPAGNINTYTRILEYLIKTNIEVKKFLAQLNIDPNNQVYNGAFKIEGAEGDAAITFNNVEEVEAFDRQLTQAIKGVFSTIRPDIFNSDVAYAAYGLSSQFNNSDYSSTAINNLTDALSNFIKLALGEEEWNNYINGNPMFLGYSARGNGTTINTSFSQNTWYKAFTSLVDFISDKTDIEITQEKRLFIQKLDKIRTAFDNPVKEGIFYNPRFQPNPSRDASQMAMSYPATNIDGHFYLTVVAQTPDFIISGDPLEKIKQLNSTSSVPPPSAPQMDNWMQEAFQQLDYLTEAYKKLIEDDFIQHCGNEEIKNKLKQELIQQLKRTAAAIKQELQQLGKEAPSYNKENEKVQMPSFGLRPLVELIINNVSSVNDITIIDARRGQAWDLLSWLKQYKPRSFKEDFEFGPDTKITLVGNTLRTYKYIVEYTHNGRQHSIEFTVINPQVDGNFTKKIKRPSTPAPVEPTQVNVVELKNTIKSNLDNIQILGETTDDVKNIVLESVEQLKTAIDTNDSVAWDNAIAAFAFYETRGIKTNLQDIIAQQTQAIRNVSSNLDSCTNVQNLVTLLLNLT